MLLLLFIPSDAAPPAILDESRFIPPLMRSFVTSFVG